MYIYCTRVSKLERKESNCVRKGIKGIELGWGHGGKTKCTDFKIVKNGDPADFIHCGKCKFPPLIAYQTRTRLKQTDYPILVPSD